MDEKEKLIYKARTELYDACQTLIDSDEFDEDEIMDIVAEAISDWRTDKLNHYS